MDWQIRLAILVGGLLLVAYIVFDYRRKKKRQRDNERLKRQFSQDPDQVDRAGFDMTGVGSVRKVADSNSNTEQIEEPNSTTKQVENIRQEPIISVEQVDLGESIEDYILERSLPKGKKIQSQKLGSKKKKQSEAKKISSVEQPGLILSLILQAEKEAIYTGIELTSALVELGLEFGEKEIFHKYQKQPSNTTQSSPDLWFSLANAFKPGSFDMQDLQSLQTTALVAFVCLPGPKQPEVAYENMYQTLDRLRQKLGGKLVDESRSSYTQQTHNHRLEQIRDFLNKQH